MIEGNVLLLGQDINTDLITSSKYFSGDGPLEEKLRHTLYDYDPDFGIKYSAGTILVAKSNFGCGSSREIAAIAFKNLGVPAILADSFARTFYRNSINIGLPVFEIPGISSIFEDGQIAQIDSVKGIITNISTEKNVKIMPIPPEIQEIINCGGLIPYIEKMLG